MEKTAGNTASPTASRLPETGKSWASPLRLLGHHVFLAREVADLEACLSLERGLAPSPNPDSLGLESPAAVPYCEFLLVREGGGALAGLCRLLSHGPDVPVRHPLASGRFRLSPLLTAIRYSRLELLEAGPLRVAPGHDPDRVRALLWAGIRQVMERGKAAILLGRERLDCRIPRDCLARLVAAYALPPDLAVEPRESFALGGGYLPEAFRWQTRPADLLPDSLREALQRGCRLAGEPVWSPDGTALELTWVATGDMLSA